MHFASDLRRSLAETKKTHDIWARRVPRTKVFDKSMCQQIKTMLICLQKSSSACPTYTSYRVGKEGQKQLLARLPPRCVEPSSPSTRRHCDRRRSCAAAAAAAAAAASVLENSPPSCSVWCTRCCPCTQASSSSSNSSNNGNNNKKKNDSGSCKM